MRVCHFERINNLTLDCARNSIHKYCSLPGPWLHQYDNYFNTIRSNENSVNRMLKLLEIVRYDGWGMNRKRQCSAIIHKINVGEITIKELDSFWNIVDNLSGVKLRELSETSQHDLSQIALSFYNIRNILNKWHASADSLCFLTKVMLMFNWGQSPAFDTRIRHVLKVNNYISDMNLVNALMEIGAWIQQFESNNGIQLDKFATDEMNKVNGMNQLQPLPLGRSFDMLLFTL